MIIARSARSARFVVSAIAAMFLVVACGGEAETPPASGTTDPAATGTPGTTGTAAAPGTPTGATDPAAPTGPSAPAAPQSHISIGPNGGCALGANGAPACWSLTAPPTVVASVPSLVELAVGETYACGLDAAGAMTCWPITGAAAPAAPSGTFVDLTIIGDVLCAAMSDGRVLCPLAEAGQETRPCAVREPAASCFVAGLSDAVEVSGGGSRACARRRGGEVTCWDATRPTPVAEAITGAVEIGADVDLVCARTASGVSCRGPGAASLTAPPPASAEPAEGAPPPETPPVAPTELATIDLPDLSGATRIVVRANGLCARLADGAWHCGGDDSTARFGDGATGQRQPPIPATAFGTATEVALTDVAGCALDGTAVRCTGLGDRGALGPEARRTVFRAHRAIAPPTDPTTRATDLVVLGDATCARSGEHLRCWGPAEWHEHIEGLGAEARPRRISPSHLGLRGRVPTIVDAWRVGNDITRCTLHTDALLTCHEEVHRRADVRAMASGGAGTCTVHTDGTIECLRQLDDGGIFFETTAHDDPDDVASLAIGGSFACAANETGTVLCAGAHEALGWPLPRGTHAPAENQAPPWVELDDVEAEEIAVGDGSLCIRTPAGAASCVGIDVDATHPMRPVDLATENVERIVGGTGFACALVRAPETPGDVVCLSSSSEMLAHDMSASTATRWTRRSIAGLLDCFDAAVVLPPPTPPAPPATLPTTPAVLEIPGTAAAPVGLVELVAGPSHACVLRSDGAVYCWGHDLVGQLGALPHALRVAPLTLTLP